MKVSVSIITYNHEKFIEQAIDGVLNQNATFAYEIVIGDDCSTDETRSLIKAYKERYPERLRLLLHKHNFGDLGTSNLVSNVKASTGEYIALLDGDDYWISSDKLQRQVDYLDSHPECAICFHRVQYVAEDGTARVSRSLSRKQTYSLGDLLRENFIPSGSAMFRRGLFPEFPDWYYTGTPGDWGLHILNAEHGNIGYIDAVMAVHRHHSSGVSQTNDGLSHMSRVVKACGRLDAHLDFKYHSTLSTTTARVQMQMASVYGEKGDYSQAREYWRASLPRSLMFFAREAIAVALLIHSPRVYRALRSVKHKLMSWVGRAGLTCFMLVSVQRSI